MEKVPWGYQNPQKWGPLGTLGALWHAFGPPGGQKRRFWELLGPILVRVVAEGSILAPKMEPMGPPSLPKWGQNGSKIHPKFVPNSIRFFVMCLDHFGEHFGSQNGDNLVTFSRFEKKSWKFVDMLILLLFATFLQCFEGPRAWNFEKNEAQDPFGMGYFFTWFLDQFLSCFGSHFGAFWKPKSSKNMV